MPTREPSPAQPFAPQTLEDKVKVIVAETLTADDDDVTLNAHIVHDLHADSLDEVEIVMRLEEEFQIDLDDDDIELFGSVQSYVDYLKKHGVKYEPGPAATVRRKRHSKVEIAP